MNFLKLSPDSGVYVNFTLKLLLAFGTGLTIAALL